MSWRMAAGLLGVLVALGGCVSSDDIEAVRRDVAALRQEVAGLAKTNEGARAFTDERLSKLEADLRSRFETTVKEGEGARAALALRLDELATETRLVQGKLKRTPSSWEISTAGWTRWTSRSAWRLGGWTVWTSR